MPTRDTQAGTDAHPGEAPPGLDDIHLPQGGRKPRLTYERAGSDRERLVVESFDAGDGRRPFVPTVHVAHDLPHAVSRSVDVDRYAVVLHLEPVRSARSMHLLTKAQEPASVETYAPA